MTTLVIFGAAGNLAGNKLLPAVYELSRRNILPEGFALVGVDRQPWSQEQFVERVHDKLRAELGAEFDDGRWRTLSRNIRYLHGSVTDPATFVKLQTLLSDLTQFTRSEPNYAFYLALPPHLFELVAAELGSAGLGNRAGGWSRVVVEKPFGTSGESALRLNQALEEVFAQNDVYRIDHYLAKAAVQQLPRLRFGSEPWQQLLSRKHIDHVQITIAEQDGVGDRLGFYDETGAVRDVLQNHLMQLLALAGMEKPASTSLTDHRVAKDAVLAVVEAPADVATAISRGQYARGDADSELGYLEQLAGAGGNFGSTTETFVAVQLDVNSERWRGVPFYLRTGKRMPARLTEVAFLAKGDLGSIVIRIQPNPVLQLRLSSQPAIDIAIPTEGLEGYEQIIADVLAGRSALFPTQSEVIAGWRLVDPILQLWDAATTSIEQYPSGSWGPASADDLMARSNRAWRNV